MEHGSIFYIKNYTLNRNHLTTFFSAKFEDEEHHFKCHILPIRFDYNAIFKYQNRKIADVLLLAKLGGTSV